MTTEQQKFQKASENERQKMMQIFNQFGVTQYEFTPSVSYDRIDGYYTASTGTEYVFEVKTRNNAASAYNYNTAIEKSKVEYIQGNTKEIPHQPILFFFYNDNQAYYQQLDYEKEYDSFRAFAPATTFGDQTMVLKDFVGFNINKKHLLKLN
ncbi:hypothetical protein G7A72_03225 [Flavobacterium sp. Sr18]|uniref:hypothetical protein n=1 Tax=Flavobacterium sp. Sr18 TaxID=935222 RepID=UPI0013E4FCA8|nr:hypothetical protein [Flavobacterium sp. Sr18]QIH37871.1 hypothetical protein G7A72_03225 [Flavobacterium sp. Sr18]